jgi:uncharacterized membrane protein YGL010W
MAVFSLSDQFSNYYEYHKNPINQALHFVGVPSIVFGVFLMLTKLPMTIPYISEMAKSHPILAPHVGFIIMVALLSYYFILNFRVGVFYFYF